MGWWCGILCTFLIYELADMYEQPNKCTETLTWGIWGRGESKVKNVCVEFLDSLTLEDGTNK
jgi:hypothetical protein